MIIAQNPRIAHQKRRTHDRSEVITLTARQEAHMLISIMPEEQVKHLVDFLKSSNLGRSASRTTEHKSMRIGAGKGVIFDSPNFDKYDSEIAALFEGESL